MLKIRLTRQGKGHNKFYKIVAMDEKSKPTGKMLEDIGYWQPSKNLMNIDRKKIESLVSKGARVTKAVEKLLQK